MKNFSKHYAALKPAERAALAIEALARGDTLDASRLTEACPQRRYKGPDLRFGMRLSALHQAALTYQAEVLKISMFAALLVGKLPYAFAPGEEQLEKGLGELQQLLSRIRGYHAAWGLFCEENGFNPASASAAYGISFSTLARGMLGEEELEGGPPPNAVACATLLEILRELWKIVGDFGD